mmetsp:Transcript_8382/g.22382  ORF Transcript_8382/g.22382 Transcript_8382/m.22382 type:complete len:102 (-) Transcript_8382:160-465(-)
MPPAPPPSDASAFLGDPPPTLDGRKLLLPLSISLLSVLLFYLSTFLPTFCLSTSLLSLYFTAILLYCYTATLLHCFTASLLHCYTAILQTIKRSAIGCDQQ